MMMTMVMMIIMMEMVMVAALPWKTSLPGRIERIRGGDERPAHGVLGKTSKHELPRGDSGEVWKTRKRNKGGWYSSTVMV